MCGHQLRIIMANSMAWATSQQQEMSDFESADNFPPGDGFNIGELSGMEGTYDRVLYISCSEKGNLKRTPTYCSSASTILIYFCIYVFNILNV